MYKIFSFYYYFYFANRIDDAIKNLMDRKKEYCTVIHDDVCNVIIMKKKSVYSNGKRIDFLQLQKKEKKKWVIENYIIFSLMCIMILFIDFRSVYKN
jgi:hypothetical protein